MDIHELESKIHSMVDDLQGLCSTVGLSNTANEEVVVTSVFLYKFLNDKFMYNLGKFSEEIDVPVESILKNEDDMLDAFYEYNSKDVAFSYEDTIQYLINHIEQQDFYKQFDDALVRISKNVKNEAFAVETADGEKTDLFEPLTVMVESAQRNNFAKAIFGIIAKDKFDFSEAFGGSFDFYSAIFEYLIKNYNVASGTYAEYFTPQTVSSIIAKILVGMSNTIEAAEIYDPAAGSGSLILHLAHELGQEGGMNRAIVYTQDISKKSTRFLRLNMMLNGKSESLGNIIRGDTLESPAHFNVEHEPDSGVKKFDYITTNPPFGIPKYPIDTRNRIEQKWADTKRFENGVPNVPPKKNFQIYLLFIQHVLYSLKEDGKAAIVVPTGFLTAQNGIELTIRQRLVDQKILKGVISMPANIFANTGTNVSVLFLDKSNTDDDVILIDASNLGEEIRDGKNKKTVLRESEVQLIIDTFINRESIEKFSTVTSFESLKKNYSLNAGQYFAVVVNYEAPSIAEFSSKIGEMKAETDYKCAELNRIHESIQTLLNELEYSAKANTEGFVKRKLSDIADLVTSTVNPHSSPNKLFKHYSIPAFDLDRCPAIEAGAEIDSGKYLVPDNAILVSKLNPQFKRIWVPGSYDDVSICSTELLPFVAKKREDRGFLFAVVSSPAFQQYMIQCSSSSTGSRKRMQPELCGDFEFMCPTNRALIGKYNKLMDLMLCEERLAIDLNKLSLRYQEYLVPLVFGGNITFSK